MGQRLNMSITRKGKVIANAYYHWSGYTGSAAAITSRVYDFLSDNKDVIKNPKLLAIRALESTGAGLEEPEYEYLKSLKSYMKESFNIGQDRNTGLIAVTPREVKETIKWAETSSYIDMDTLLISFDSCCCYETVEDIKEWYEEFDPDVDLVEYDFESTEMDYGCFKDFITNILDGKYVKLNDGIFSELG